MINSLEIGMKMLVKILLIELKLHNFEEKKYKYTGPCSKVI